MSTECTTLDNEFNSHADGPRRTWAAGGDWFTAGAFSPGGCWGRAGPFCDGGATSSLDETRVEHGQNAGWRVRDDVRMDGHRSWGTSNSSSAILSLRGPGRAGYPSPSARAVNRTPAKNTRPQRVSSRQLAPRRVRSFSMQCSQAKEVNIVDIVLGTSSQYRHSTQYFWSLVRPHSPCAQTMTPAGGGLASQRSDPHLPAHLHPVFSPRARRWRTTLPRVEHVPVLCPSMA